jgi:uncharacterized membrane protein
VFERHVSRVRELLGRYLVSGILVFAPVGITLWAVGWVIERLDRLLLPRLLAFLSGEAEAQVHTPFVGALFTLLVVILLGVITRHFLRPELLRAWERLVARVPLAGNLYAGVKQLFEAIFNGTDTSQFNRVVVIEYPRKNLFAIAFTTGESRGLITEALDRKLVNCFIPTTPTPTSGVFIMVPEEDAVELDMSIEEGFKLVMSAGLVNPSETESEAVPSTIASPATAGESS